MEEEIWRVPPGYSSIECSSLGDVRDRETKVILNKTFHGRRRYYCVRVIPDNCNRKCTQDVHILIALAFLGPNLNNYDVDHIDANKLNNRADNLEYVTRSENIRRAYKTGLNKYVNPVEIIETGESFDSINECARAINGDPERIRQCLLYPKYTRKTHRGYHFRSLRTDEPIRKPIKVRIIETGEVFNTVRECERAINGFHTNIMYACKNGVAYKGLHFEILEEDECEEMDEPKRQPFLRDYQMNAVNNMFNGCILNGGTGSGKSRTGIYYYFKEQGGQIDENGYIPMKTPKDLIVITTAKKRDDGEWIGEFANFLMSVYPQENKLYNNKIIVDSWQNIGKYKDVRHSFFIFDEDHVTGNGSWVKSFLKIAKYNDWIILSATPGDDWMDFVPVFIANNFYRNKTEFINQHVVYSRFTKYPKVDKYINTGRLIRLRNKLLIDMDFVRHTVQHHENIFCNYDLQTYKQIMKNRWDVFRNEPITQASGLCYCLRKLVNSDESRQLALLELFEKHPRIIIFYSYDYERDILLNLYYGDDVEIAEYSGHKHQPVPDSKRWIYLINYSSGSEAFNCIKTDTIVFYSQTYSYKTLLQAAGRIDRMNSPYTDLYYYHFQSRSSIDLAISKALKNKKKFNERRFSGFDK